MKALRWALIFSRCFTVSKNTLPACNDDDDDDNDDNYNHDDNNDDDDDKDDHDNDEILTNAASLGDLPERLLLRLQLLVNLVRILQCSMFNVTVYVSNIQIPSHKCRYSPHTKKYFPLTNIDISLTQKDIPLTQKIFPSHKKIFPYMHTCGGSMSNASSSFLIGSLQRRFRA